MITILSPAKTLDFTTNQSVPTTTPENLNKAAELTRVLQKKSPEALQDIMGISEQLADLNHGRWQDWKEDKHGKEGKAAIFAFKGDVYQGLEADGFTKTTLDFAQKHLYILSGLYGVLKPFDTILPYRLEMGTKMDFKGHKTLYSFWGNLVTEQLSKALKNHQHKVLVNLASQEYFKVVKPKKLEAKIITPNFKEYRNGKYKVISFNAKKARGSMAKVAMENQIADPEELKNIEAEGYSYNDSLSDGGDWLFTK